MIQCAFSNYLVTSISEKTKIKPKLVITILELFVYLMKRTLIDEKEFYICTFGSFRLMTPRHSKWKKVVHATFRSVDYMKSVMKGSAEPMIKHSCDKKMLEKFKKISNVLGLTHKQVKYLFNLFFYNITIQLLQDNEYKINRFGYFKIMNDESILQKKYIKGMTGKINCKVLKFKPITTFKREINGKCTEIKVGKRVRRLLYHAQMDISTKQLLI